MERGIRADTSLDATVKPSLVQAQRGRGAFRAAVETRDRAARLKGVTNPEPPIAGHIKPWRLCETAEARLDGRNDLKPTPTLTSCATAASSASPTTARG